jgi:hypothetical protein
MGSQYLISLLETPTAIRALSIVSTHHIVSSSHRGMTDTGVGILVAVMTVRRSARSDTRAKSSANTSQVND